MYVNFLSTYSDKKSCHTSTTLQTSIARFVSDSWTSCCLHCDADKHTNVCKKTILFYASAAHASPDSLRFSFVCPVFCPVLNVFFASQLSIKFVMNRLNDYILGEIGTGTTGQDTTKIRIDVNGFWFCRRGNRRWRLANEFTYTLHSGVARNLIWGYTFSLVVAISKRVNVPHVNKTLTDVGEGIYTDIPPSLRPWHCIDYGRCDRGLNFTLI